MKLTNGMRDSIIKTIMKNKIIPLRDTLQKGVDDAGKTYIIKKMKPYEKIIEKAPKELFYSTENFIIYPDSGTYASVGFSLHAPMVVLYAWRYSSSEAHIPLDKEEKSDITIFQNLVKEEQSLSKYEDSLRRELRSVVYGCTTVEKLIEILPEVKDCVNLEEIKFYPPMVNPDNLRKLMQER